MRLFLRKSRVGSGYPVYTRSKNTVGANLIPTSRWLWDFERGRELDWRVYMRRTHDGAVWATVDHRANRVLACHPEAWRILGWQAVGSASVILPAETFGALPAQGSE